MPVKIKKITIPCSLLITACSLLYMFCSCSSPKEGIYKKTKILMDTLVTITVVSGTKENAEKAIDAAFLELEKLEKRASFFSPDSEISRINSNAGISGVKVSSDILDIISRSLYVSEKTLGAFDISIGPVSSLYDFRKHIKPDWHIIRKILPLVNYRYVIIDEGKSSVFLKKKGMQIDPGGIAKGFAADKAVDILKKQGIHAGIVAVAGEIKTFGLKPDGQPWKIGIRNPRATDREDDIMATTELTDMAISTSGDYERFFISEGKRYHHLLDPETGLPAGDCMSVTVIAKDAVFTDAFATGVFILGPEKGLKLLDEMGLEGIIVDSRGKMHITSGIRGKVEFKKAS
jgi:thiamine biosynthesis lipoprotein